MATPTKPAVLRWNRPETEPYTGPESMNPHSRTSRVTSKCGRVEILCVDIEFRDFVIDVDGERVLGPITVNGRQVGHGEVTGVVTAKRAAAEILAD